MDEIMGVFVQCINIYQQRNRQYKGLWKADGWRGTIFQARHKMRRAWQQWWHDGGTDELAYVDATSTGDSDRTFLPAEGGPEYDSLFDCINYLAFTIVNANNRNEMGDASF